MAVVCDQAYTCFAPADRNADFVAAFGTTLDECKTAGVAEGCADWAPNCSNFSASHGMACNEGIAALTCDELFSSVPIPDCDLYCSP